MTVEFYDAALRALSAQRAVAVPRIESSPLPATYRRLAVAVTRGRNRSVSVTVTDEAGRTDTGTDAEGLAAIGRMVGADTDTPVTALVIGRAGVDALGTLARRTWRVTDPQVATGAAVADWWAERAAHPGSGAVIDLVAASAVKYALGVTPGSESEQVWRSWLGCAEGGTHRWHDWWALLDASGPRLAGLDGVGRDDAWLWGHHLGAVAAGGSWNTRETMGLAALRLRSRCEAAESWDAALLGDRLWRRRAVHTGHVCTGTVVVGGTGRSPRVEVVTDRFDVRMKAGSAVIGWAGGIDAAPTSGPGAFAGEVTATAVAGDQLRIAVAGLGRRVPAADQTVTLMIAPPSPSVAFATRNALRALYRQASSWLARGTAPTPARRQVPLSVVVAAAASTPNTPPTEGQH